MLSPRSAEHHGVNTWATTYWFNTPRYYKITSLGILLHYNNVLSTLIFPHPQHGRVSLSTLTFPHHQHGRVSLQCNSTTWEAHFPLEELSVIIQETDQLEIFGQVKLYLFTTTKHELSCTGV